MPRKISVKKAAKAFNDSADEILEFFNHSRALLHKHHVRCAEYSIIWLYREFEKLMLLALSGAINNDASTISQVVGCKFPPHLSQPVCEYLIIGNGYFDFRGREGLIKTLREFVPPDHWLVKTIKKDEYRDVLEKLSAIRNFAAHDSKRAKETAKAAVGSPRLGTAGQWLTKEEDRFPDMVDKLKEIAVEIGGFAPY